MIESHCGSWEGTGEEDILNEIKTRCGRLVEPKICRNLTWNFFETRLLIDDEVCPNVAQEILIWSFKNDHRYSIHNKWHVSDLLTLVIDHMILSCWFLSEVHLTWHWAWATCHMSVIIVAFVNCHMTLRLLLALKHFFFHLTVAAQQSSSSLVTQNLSRITWQLSLVITYPVLPFSL